jgi:flavin-dependent dehydrogenase
VEVDVAILGAGPAGSTLATLLTRRGVSVALVDRDTFPRDKLCGEFLSYDALPILERLGLMDQLAELGATTISRCRVISGEAKYEFDLPAPARGISRLRFDDLLFGTAQASGARRFDGWTAEVLPRPPAEPQIALARGEETLVLNPRVLVGAWGRWGRNDRVLKREFVREHRRRHFGFKRHYRGPSETDVIELHSYHRGYLGVSAVEGGVINICGLVHESRLKGLKGGWESFTQQLSSERGSLQTLFGSHTPVDKEFLSSEPVIFVPKSAVEAGVFMVGDAAGLVDPLTGNGMAMALQSALIAAPRILERLQGSKNEESAYHIRFREFFGARLWSRRIAFLLSRPALLTPLLKLHGPGRIGRFLVERTRAQNRNLQAAIEDWFHRQR